jgi:peptidylprolyl isomerase
VQERRHARRPPTPTPTIPTNAAGASIALVGSTISVHYHGTLDDGEVFDSSLDREPFTVAAGQMIPGFDAAVLGRALGEKKTVRIPPEKAYGPRFDELIIQMPLEEFSGVVSVGHQVTGHTGASYIVVAINDAIVTLDGNRPLAGKPLTFEIEIVESK